MVTVTDKQLIISIDVHNPAEHLSNLRSALIALMQNFNEVSHKDAPVYYGLELLKELIPDQTE